MKSWKTTAVGVCTFVIAAATAISAMLDNDPATVPDWTVVSAMVATGIGMIFARDNNKTSEDVKAK